MIFDDTLKLCSGHYIDLRRALQHKGIWHLCTVDAHLRGERAKMWLAGQCPAHQFDPFAVSLLEMRNKLSDLTGGHPVGCLLCNAMKLLDNEKVPAAWLDNITDLMVVTARVNGLVSSGLMH